MDTRHVTGILRHIDGSVWAGATLTFTLTQSSYVDENTFPPDEVTTETGGDGTFDVELWTNGEGALPVFYTVTLPNDDTFTIVVPAGVDDVLLTAVRTNEEAPSGWQVTVQSIVDDALADLDHGALLGLSDDDHAQYHTDARGDARYYTQAQVTTNISSAVATHDADTTNVHGITDTANLVLTTDTRLSATALTEFATPGATSYDPPAWATWIDVTVVGGGGGGGGGARNTTGTVRAGGGGGGGAGSVIQRYHKSFFGANWPTLTVTVGAAGVGGAGATSDGGTGTSGTSGGETWVEVSGQRLARGFGGGGGGGGSTTAGGAGSNGAGFLPGVGGGAGAQSAAGGSPTTNQVAAGGGGGGGGVTGANAALQPGSGGAGARSFVTVSGASAGVSGATGTVGSDANTPLYNFAGGGGGGGGSSTGAAGADGGIGKRGGGGGGGGGGTSANGGTGGNGGTGYAVIVAGY